MGDFELRPATADDIGRIGELVRAAEAYDGVPRALSDEELSQELDAPHLDLADDTRVATRAGEIVGWAYVWHPTVEEGLDRVELHGEVAPAHRGQGIGRALLGWSVERASARLTATSNDPDRPTAVRTNTYDWLEDRHRLYRRLGFDAVRWHDELLRPLTDLPPVSIPDGISLHPWPGEDEGREDELRRMRNAAFADHWGSTVVDPDLWQDFTRGHGSRPDLSVIAVDDATGELVGECVNQAYPEDEEVTGRKDAWIANVCTLRPARGRGIGTAMIAWSLHAFAAAGFDHAMLDVDSANPTGAARLYRALGFEPLHRSITFELAR